MSEDGGMIKHRESTLTKPPSCPKKWDHLSDLLGYDPTLQRSGVGVVQREQDLPLAF